MRITVYAQRPLQGADAYRTETGGCARRLACRPATLLDPSGGCYEIENAKREKLGDFADFETNQLAFG